MSICLCFVLEQNLKFVAQAALAFASFPLCSTSLVLGLQARTTMPTLSVHFLKRVLIFPVYFLEGESYTIWPLLLSFTWYNFRDFIYAVVDVCQ